MTATIATPIRTTAELVTEALGLPADSRIHAFVTRDGWDNAWCEETGKPGAVTVAWGSWDGEEGCYLRTDRTLAGDIAGAFINTIAMSDQTDAFDTIDIEVSRHYLRFVHPDIADAL